MTDTYLSSDELAELAGCMPTSYKCMRRWLDRNGWPYVINGIGRPIVSRAFHDAKLNGANPDRIKSDNEPNFGALAA